MTLMIEKGFTMERHQLAGIATPEHTKTHRPVAHIDAANLTVEYAKGYGYDIIKEEFGLNPSGSQMFGILTLKQLQGDSDMARCIGIRNSHDKTLAFGLTAGVSVMVCSNLCFGGEATVKRKHTSGIDLSTFIPEIFEQLDDQYGALDVNIHRMKASKIYRSQQAAMVCHAAKEGVCNSSDILPVLDMFENPLHEEFSERTEWSLYNCFNEVAKKYPAARADKCYRKLARFFNLLPQVQN